MNGVVSASSTSTNTYQDVTYHVITLPARTVPTTDAPTSLNYLKEGTITIAIVGPSTDLQSYFDTIVRLMPSQSKSHIWEYRIDRIDVQNPDGLFNMYYDSRATCSSYTSNSVTVTLNNDRLSGSLPSKSKTVTMKTHTQFKVYGRNSGDWILLKDVSGLIYTTAVRRSASI